MTESRLYLARVGTENLTMAHVACWPGARESVGLGQFLPTRLVIPVEQYLVRVAVLLPRQSCADHEQRPYAPAERWSHRSIAGESSRTQRWCRYRAALLSPDRP